MGSHEPIIVTGQAVESGPLPGVEPAYAAARRAAQGPLRAGISEPHLEYYLENWARWCKVKHGVATCDSIEHKWKSPQEWGAPGAPEVPRGAIDLVKARQVNVAWLAMPEPYKQVLRDDYVFKRNPRVTCRRYGLAFSAYDEYVRRARLMCRNLMMQAGVT